MAKTCPHCKSSDVDVDPSRGNTVCMGCGSVLEESSIVSEVSFVENSDGSSSLVGQFISGEGENHPHFVGLRHSLGKESRKITLDRGQREIKEMASSLHLSQHCVDTAYNFFKIAINKRLSRGRRIHHLVAACLYMTCRIVGTPHMLLDFSDITQVNVFVLGKTFVTLAKELHIQLPILGYLSRKKHILKLEKAISPQWATCCQPRMHDQRKRISKSDPAIFSIEMMQHLAVYPRLTDDKNLMCSSLCNAFSATTRVREIPISNIFKKELQELNCRSPSATGLRPVPLTNRAIVAPECTKSNMIAQTPNGNLGKLMGNQQVLRHILGQERLKRTREMKRQAQISNHRMDRLYFMNGATAKLHDRYSVSEVDINRLRQITISRQIKVSPSPSSYPSRINLKISSASIHSSRKYHCASDAGSASETIIPTAGTFCTGELLSNDGASDNMIFGRDDASTSDHSCDADEITKMRIKDHVREIVSQGVGSEVDEESNEVLIRSGRESLQNQDEVTPEEKNATLAISGGFLTDMINEN